MPTRAVPAVVLAVAVALLATSVAWAIAREDEGPAGHAGSWMMGEVAGERTARVTSIAQARERAEAFAARLDLRVGDVLQFERNFYAVLVDRGARPATELLVDPATGVVALEYGPAMMWNTEHGMRSGRGRASMHDTGGRRGAHIRRGAASGGGMMDGGVGAAMMDRGGAMMQGGGGMVGARRDASRSAERISPAQARDRAERWLGRSSGSELDGTGHAFPGYFTFRTVREGKVSGMVSVDEASGVVWPHWWHGRFVAQA